jgi:hypothetical protein
MNCRTEFTYRRIQTPKTSHAGQGRAIAVELRQKVRAALLAEHFNSNLPARSRIGCGGLPLSAQGVNHTSIHGVARVKRSLNAQAPRRLRPTVAPDGAFARTIRAWSISDRAINLPTMRCWLMETETMSPSRQQSPCLRVRPDQISHMSCRIPSAGMPPRSASLQTRPLC